MRRLTAEDYSVDAVTMAKALVGAWLCRRFDDGTVIRRRITETEAYCGEEDTACHAHKGRTARTDVMYSPGGCAYIYLCYGMHEMLNVVTGPEGRPEAVLIRGVECCCCALRRLCGIMSAKDAEIFCALHLST